MSERIVVTLAEPPSSNRYWRRHGKIIHLSREAQAYRQAVTMLTANYRTNGRVVFPTGDLGICVTWHRSARRGDLGNRTKCLYDSLQGSIYADDKQIAHEVTWRVDHHPHIAKGHVRVEVWRLTEDELWLVSGFGAVMAIASAEATGAPGPAPTLFKVAR